MGKIVYQERDKYRVECTIRKEVFESRFGKENWNDLYLKEWYEKFEKEMNMIPEIRIQQHHWIEEAIFEISLISTYSNPLSVMVDMNRQYPYLKVEMHLHY